MNGWYTWQSGTWQCHSDSSNNLCCNIHNPRLLVTTLVLEGFALLNVAVMTMLPFLLAEVCIVPVFAVSFGVVVAAADNVAHHYGGCGRCMCEEPQTL